MGKPALVAVDFSYTDPWTGEWLAGWRMPWTKQRAARAHYSRQIKLALGMAKLGAGLRKPKLTIKLIRN